MRLFGKISGTVDRRDRAEWLTMPFDLAIGSRPGTHFVAAGRCYAATAAAGSAYQCGAAAGKTASA